MFFSLLAFAYLRVAPIRMNISPLVYMYVSPAKSTGEEMCIQFGRLSLESLIFSAYILANFFNIVSVISLLISDASVGNKFKIRNLFTFYL